MKSGPSGGMFLILSGEGESAREAAGKKGQAPRLADRPLKLLVRKFGEKCTIGSRLFSLAWRSFKLFTVPLLVITFADRSPGLSDLSNLHRFALNPLHHSTVVKVKDEVEVGHRVCYVCFVWDVCIINKTGGMATLGLSSDRTRS